MDPSHAVCVLLIDHLVPASKWFDVFQAKDEVLEAALDAALEVGYRHIDTAAAYENEHVVGKVLKKWIDSGRLKREDVFITTKVGTLPM